MDERVGMNALDGASQRHCPHRVAASLGARQAKVSRTPPINDFMRRQPPRGVRRQIGCYPTGGLDSRGAGNNRRAKVPISSQQSQNLRPSRGPNQVEIAYGDERGQRGRDSVTGQPIQDRLGPVIFGIEVVPSGAQR